MAGPGGWLGRRPGWLLRAAVIALAVLCVADWVLVQDFGFFGGLGTDPNSMPPMLLIAVAAYLALTRAAVPVPALRAARPLARPQAAWRSRLRPAAVPAAVAAASVRTVLSASAIGVIALGAVPMVAAQASPAASAILAESIDGSSAPLSAAAPGFTLTDQDGRRVALSSLRGKAVLLAFLDPVCTTDCPLEAQEFRQAGQQLGTADRRVELVAVNLNPLYNSTAYTRAFDREEQLSGVRNWLFLTGSPAQLRAVWEHYGIASQTLPAGSMLGHTDAAFVIGPGGRLRAGAELRPRPGHGGDGILLRHRAGHRRAAGHRLMSAFPAGTLAWPAAPARQAAAVLGAVIAVGAAAAGCGSVARPAAARPAAPVSLPLATSLSRRPGDLGGRPDGLDCPRSEPVLAALHAARGRPPLGPRHPPGRGHQRCPRRGPRRRPGAGRGRALHPAAGLLPGHGDR